MDLVSYYRRFVNAFEKIARPLVDMLKKDNFLWTKESAQAFSDLKLALTTAHVLFLPDFNKTFGVETHASGKGTSVVIM